MFRFASNRGSPRGGNLLTKWQSIFLLTVLATWWAMPLTSGAESLSSEQAVASVIARYQQRIPELMDDQDVPGLAIAVVDGPEVIWSQGFGHLKRGGSAPVTTETIFSVQSMSKLFTATGVMIAVQDGVLDLDEPIVTYLPEFTVNSAFERHPEQTITLRMLLGHTAGFTHEAPIGNNLELDPGDFDAHVKSISDTWLRFPVGSGYAYSNLGIDLAGYVLEREYGRPFAEVMRELVLEPIGMYQSTFDRTTIRTTVDRASGHVSPLPEVPIDIPMTAAGGLYSNVEDLSRFLSFQLGNGSVNQRVVLDPGLMNEMRTVPAPHQGAIEGYALGVDRTRWVAGHYADLFSHGGGGFGFLADLWWLPQLQLGIAVLTNSADHSLQGDLALSVLSDLTHEPGSIYRERLGNLPIQGGLGERGKAYRLPAELPALVADAAQPPIGDEAERWGSYCGDFVVRWWTAVDPGGPSARFLLEDGVPYFEANDESTRTRHRLYEIAPGLFMAEDGETLDLRGDVPTWRNIEIIRVSGDPTQWQWIALVLVGLVASGWLIAATARGIRHLRRRQGLREPEPIARRLASILASVTAALCLGVLALIALEPGVVDSGFVGWLHLPLVERLMLHLPFALTVVGVCLVSVGTLGFMKGWWRGWIKLAYTTLFAATAFLIGQLSWWHLIGWGWT